MVKERGGTSVISLPTVQESPRVKAFLKQADDNFIAIGYKEHGFRHANLAANIARNVLKHLGYSDRESELAGIAGYLHDIGNAIGRNRHAQSGAVLSLPILTQMGMALEEVSQIIRAIGGHEEKEVDPDSAITAAVILGDKTDVHFTRVRNLPGKSKLVSTFTTHDRVNLACERAFLNVDRDAGKISLELTIDTRICSVMEYFEIFLSRVLFCQRATKYLGHNFVLFINKVKFL